MKRLTAWLLLILIGLAILLSAEDAKLEPLRDPKVKPQSTNGELHRPHPDDQPRTTESHGQYLPNASHQQVPGNLASLNSDNWYFNLSLAVFSGGLLIVAAVQSVLLWWTFHADHRPRLKINQVKLLNDLTKENALYKEPITVSLHVINRGAGRAKIIRGNVTFFFRALKDRPWRRNEPVSFDYKGTEDVLRHLKLKPTAERVVEHSELLDEGNPDAFHSIHPKVGQDLKEPLKIFYVVGYFRYQDRIGRSYTTAFCRRYDKQGQIFVPLNHPEYEYSD